MNIKKFALCSALGLGVLFTPKIAFADQGVLLKDVTLTNQEGVSETFQAGTQLPVLEETATHFTLKTPNGSQGVKAEHFMKTLIETPKHYLSTKDTTLYLEPSMLSIELQSIPANEVLHFVEETQTGNWAKVKSELGMEGWVFLNDVEMQYDVKPHATKMFIQNDVRVNGKTFAFAESVNVIHFNGTHYTVQAGDKTYEIEQRHVGFVKPQPKPVMKETPLMQVDGVTAQALIQAGSTQIGKPYVFGANGPNAWDCSSFTQYAFRQIGISIPRTASQQSTKGVHVSKSNLQPGDLVFFQTYKAGPSHVGIYVGGGKMLHAGSSRGVEVTNMNYDYWESRYLFAKRLF